MSTFRWPARIRFVDTDASRRIHYTALLRHFEAAEVEFMRYLGIPYNHLDVSQYSLPRVHVEADYLAPLTNDDLIEIEVKVGRIGEKSFTLEFAAYHGEVLAGRGKIVVAVMSVATAKACALPQYLREGLQACVNSSQGT